MANISNNQHLMRQAKMALSGGWMMAAVATLIYELISGVAGYTGIVLLIVYGPLVYGYYAYLNNQINNQQQDFNLLFCGFSSRFVELMVAGLLYLLIVALGTCLLLVPGIIAGLGLSMTFLIMIDEPNIRGVDALKKSWDLMQGHKWDLFCLYCRFIGWCILCIITMGVLTFWIQPYQTTSQIFFYRQLVTSRY